MYFVRLRNEYHRCRIFQVLVVKSRSGSSSGVRARTYRHAQNSQPVFSCLTSDISDLIWFLFGGTVEARSGQFRPFDQAWLRVITHDNTYSVIVLMKLRLCCPMSIEKESCQKSTIVSRESGEANPGSQWSGSPHFDSWCACRYPDKRRSAQNPNAAFCSAWSRTNRSKQPQDVVTMPSQRRLWARARDVCAFC